MTIKIVNKIMIVFLILFTILILTIFSISTYFLKQDVKQLKSNLNQYNEFFEGTEWVCEQIIYIYPKDKYPSKFINENYKIYLFNYPELKEFYCAYGKDDKCISDIKKGVYDEYCIEWRIRRRLDSVWDGKAMANFTHLLRGRK